MTKNHILAEIRRTTAENGGMPFGQQRFSAATGIRKADWHGRFWVRWGDAVREAGFQPNEFTSAVPEANLLRKLAQLTGELGHMPVDGELKLKARTDPAFPSHSTFRRLGNKGAMAARLRAFCISQGREDLAALCPSTADQAPVAEAVVTSDSSFGFVYLMRSGRFYKVGRTNAVGRRERELAIQLPEKVQLVHSIKTDDPIGIEAYWHRRFQDRRKNGEWFQLTAQDVSAFRRRKFM